MPLLYTVVPDEVIFGPDDGEEEAAPTAFAWQRGRAAVQVVPVGERLGRIVRVFSTDPRDYLDPSLEPGRLIELTGSGTGGASG